MKLLHTSDWHLGRNLFGRKRTDEFSRFLDWLQALTISRQIDVLCIAGDVFDTTTPNNTTLSLYYTFLERIISSGCRKVVITGGNHDSPALLEAPKQLLKNLNIEVIGRAAALDEEIIPVFDQAGMLEALVCAVPYLRDQDVRLSLAGENFQEKVEKYIEGIAAHFHQLHELLKTSYSQHITKIPIIGMGHLFAAGGKTMEGDGTRDLYVGSLAHIHADLLPDAFDYFAFGHLHTSQKVGGRHHWRYSGSPLPMNFSDAVTAKKVILVDFDNGERTIELINVPCFQRLQSIRGGMDAIRGELSRLKHLDEPVWLEIIYDGEPPPAPLGELLADEIKDSRLDILRIVNTRLAQTVLEATEQAEPLENLTPDEVFSKCLTAHDLPGDASRELTLRYREVIDQIARDEP